MADAPMDDGDVELERRVEAEVARRAEAEAELTRRVEAARADMRAQLEGEWRGRVENADRGLGGAAQAAPPPPRNFANYVARPSRYDGRAQSLNDWLFTFKLSLRATGVEPESEEAIVTAATYLDKDAIGWWRHLSDRMDLGNEPRINTWSAFCAAITARFQVVDEDRHARIALTQLRQTGTVRAYLQEFQRLSLLAPGSNERDQVVRFTLGLRGDVRMEVDRGHPTTILAAMTLADEAESRLHGYRSNPQPAWNQPRRNYNQGATNMELGAMSTAAGRGRPSGRGGRPQGRGGQRPAMQRGNAAKGYAGGQNIMTNIRCYNCGKMGHIARNCGEAQRPQQGNAQARA